MRTPTFVAEPSATVAAEPVATPPATIAAASVATSTTPIASALVASQPASVAGAFVVPTEQPDARPQRDLVRSIGLAAVFLSAALLSFDTLNRLALAVGWTGTWSVAELDLRLSWLLPVAIDCYAWLTVREWLRGSSGARRTRYAARSARVALGLTMAANALFHAFEALHWSLADNAVAAIVVGAIPPFLAERVAVMFTLGSDRRADATPPATSHPPANLVQQGPSARCRPNEMASTIGPLPVGLQDAVALVVPLVAASAPARPSQRKVREHLQHHGIRVGFPKVKLIIAGALRASSSG